MLVNRTQIQVIGFNRDYLIQIFLLNESSLEELVV